MRILGIGEDGDLADMYYRLSLAGHEVRMYVESAEAQDVFAGLVERTSDWRAELSWIRDAGPEGAVVFESAVRGVLQDRLRQDGFNVIGGSAFGDRLESERTFGQEQLAGFGLRTAACRHFTSFATAIAFVRDAPGRFVFKSNGADSLRTRNYIGQLTNGADMVALLTTYQAQAEAGSAPDFVLMDYVQGVEVGVGAYFNGEQFLTPACLDWEHKRFFTGELGELTGEMGTIVTYRGAERIFGATLALMAEPLRKSGYCGYINLNLMANEHGLWPIEFTSRFGYPGYAICEALHLQSWDEVFINLLERNSPTLATRDGYACGIVLTVPPFPHRYGYAELSKGVPITFAENMTQKDRADLHMAEVAMRSDQLVTAGMIGYVGVATGIGATIPDAKRKAEALAAKVIVPNLRYRTDIGDRVEMHDLAMLHHLGYLAP